MRIVLSWLRESCPTDLSADQIADLLTRLGAEVESVERPWDGLDGVIVAEVLEVSDHPNSTKLCRARVNTGAGELDLVVGVRNMAPGDLVPLAPPGARVPALSDPLGQREIRGVVSNGMLCSSRELGIADLHQGILILPPGLTPGTDLKSWLGLDDAVIDIEVTPNRPDFLSVLGVAREVAAATGTPFTPPPIAVLESGPDASATARVAVSDPQRCTRYLARVLDLAPGGASPLTVQARLTAAGMRPVSPAVDATNYVMLEMGQPLHAFDLDRLAGPAIEVRRARDGESIVTLDDVERRLTDDDLLICDAERPVAVAGVMGSAVAEVGESTSRILLEAATFERGGVQRTRRRLDLSTEASMRFERGVDPEVTAAAADRVCHLLQLWSDARVAPGRVEVGAAPERRRVRIRPERASVLIGHAVSADDVRAVFARLAMPVVDDGDGLAVEVPGYRVDVEREADLIEEVARLQGYDRIGSRLPAIAQVGGVPPLYAARDRIRDALVRAGLREVRPIPFASREDLALSGADEPIRVRNPLVAEEGWLRTRLLPGLLATAQRNVARQVPGVALFEVGRVFRLIGGAADERPAVVGIAMTGEADATWDRPSRGFDVLDVKGVIDALLRDLGIPWSEGPTPGLPWHPGRSAVIVVDGRAIGTFGELHPRLAQRRGFSGRVALAEFDLGEVLDAAPDRATVVHDVPRFPPLRRDLAFVLPVAARAGDVATAIAESGGDLVASVRLFDVFEGSPIGDGRRSLAFAVELRADDRTLTDEEAEEVVERVRSAVADRFGGELRSG